MQFDSLAVRPADHSYKVGLGMQFDSLAAAPRRPLLGVELEILPLGALIIS